MSARLFFGVRHGPRRASHRSRCAVEFNSSVARKAKQKEVTSVGFSNIILNFSHKEARFDSRSEPLFRLFRLLPVAIEALKHFADSSVGPDDKDRRFAQSLLRKFAGADGYDRLVSAAVIADAMVVIGRYINLSQVGRGQGSFGRNGRAASVGRRISSESAAVYGVRI